MKFEVGTAYDPDELDDHDSEVADVRITGEAIGSLAWYFEALEREALRAQGIATQARARGFDPELAPEIPFASDLAERVEKLVGPVGVAARIRELSAQLGREEVALQVAREVAQGKFEAVKSPEKALDAAIRTGLAILTEGILVAPLEGVAGVAIKHNHDGSNYAEISFAGPIRAAGGTGQALTVLIADVVRRELGLGRYFATDAEIERFKEEVPAYKQAQHLQYTPSPQEIDVIVRNVPVGINGEGTEDVEVSGWRDLPRVDTNKLRGGACLVIAEGLTLKAPKVLKHVERLGLKGWEFLGAFAKKGMSTDDKGTTGLEPDSKFLRELVAGRPVFSHPLAPGGFRLRYGRARTAGLASTAIHPAMMTLVDDFLAPGTQLKIERPGKATVATPCDTLWPPVVRLDNGDVVPVRSVEEALALRPRVSRILSLGDILVPVGEFLENNKPLVPPAWCEEWWRAACRAKGAPTEAPATAEEARSHAQRSGVPLHPRFTLVWSDATQDDLQHLRATLLSTGSIVDDRVTLEADARGKAALETVLAFHRVANDRVAVDPEHGLPLLWGLGLDVENGAIVERAALASEAPVFQAVADAGGFAIKALAPTRVGARMGRPEKAADRKMSPPVHVLFPLGDAGGMQRLVNQAMLLGTVEVEAGIRRCPACALQTVELTCPRDGTVTRPADGRPLQRKMPLDELAEQAQQRLGVRMPSVVKGVQGLISERKIPEPLEKGILRALHDVTMFKDGTCRVDMTDVPLTHFRPAEVGTGVEQLRAMGYEKDVDGRPLENEEQLLELLPQDVIVNEECLTFLHRVSKYVDDLLVRFYGIKPFYNCAAPRDLIGQLAVGLAPHTSGGVLCRIIGTTKAQVHFAHPYFHAAKRRNADGDEDSVMLLMDGLVNFSRSFLPDRRGGKMDAPLTLSLRIDPREIDKEAHNIDVCREYPLQLYEAAEAMKHPKEVKIETVASRLGTPAQYVGLWFTHDTARIDAGPGISAYKTIENMMDKMKQQLSLARRIRAVDAPDVAARVICSHFLPDLIGNMKAFSRQSFRCGKCNAKYRRVPLKGKCTKCGNNLTMTVHKASVVKYLEVSKAVALEYHVDAYTMQRIRLVEDAINSLFENDRVKKARLEDFL